MVYLTWGSAVCLGRNLGLLRSCWNSRLTGGQSVINILFIGAVYQYCVGVDAMFDDG